MTSVLWPTKKALKPNDCPYASCFRYQQVHNRSLYTDQMATYDTVWCEIYYYNYTQSRRVLMALPQGIWIVKRLTCHHGRTMEVSFFLKYSIFSILSKRFPTFQNCLPLSLLSCYVQAIGFCTQPYHKKGTKPKHSFIFYW